MPIDEQLDSLVTIGGSIKRAGISSSYNDFVNISTGIIAKHFDGKTCKYGAEGELDKHSAFKLIIEKDIHQGESWQLAAYVAHALFAQRRLSTKDVVAGDSIFIATGTIDPIDFTVGSIKFLSQKTVLSSQKILQWQQMACDVKFLVPNENYRQPLPDIPFELTSLSHLGELSQLLFAKGLAPLQYIEYSVTNRNVVKEHNENTLLLEGKHRTNGGIKLASVSDFLKDNKHRVTAYVATVLSAIMLGAILYYSWWADKNTITLSEYKIGLNACVEPVVTRYKVDITSSDTLPSFSLRGLCAIQLSISGWLKDDITDVWLLSESGALMPLEHLANGSWKIPLPSWQNDARHYSLLLFNSDVDEADFQSLSAFVLKEPNFITEPTLHSSEMLANDAPTKKHFLRSKFWIKKNKLKAKFLHHRLDL